MDGVACENALMFAGVQVFYYCFLLLFPGVRGETFECPEEFGYYPHPEDCSKYYVCVFGGPLLESCTRGLMYRSVVMEFV